MKRTLCVLSLTLVYAILTIQSSAQTVDTIDPALRAQIDRIATQVLEQTGVPAASIAVVQHGKLVYTHAYGKARLQPPEPATPSVRSRSNLRQQRPSCQMGDFGSGVHGFLICHYGDGCRPAALRCPKRIRRPRLSDRSRLRPKYYCPGRIVENLILVTA